MEGISPYARVFHISFHDLRSYQLFVCFCVYYTSVYVFLLEYFIVLGLLENACFLNFRDPHKSLSSCLGAKNLYLFVIY